MVILFCTTAVGIVRVATVESADRRTIMVAVVVAGVDAGRGRGGRIVVDGVDGCPPPLTMSPPVGG